MPASASPSKPATLSTQSLTYSEGFVAEDEVIATARARGAEVGCTPVSHGTGAALRLLTRVLDARSVVEVGTGTGVSGLWLLRGMNDEGVLTSIDTEVEHQRLARETFNDAGVSVNRVRLINGRALDVLPRLTDGGYDLMFVDGGKADYADHLEDALRLLRPGGVLAFDDALGDDRVADPAQRDPETVSLRELGKAVRDHEDLVPALLPVGTGLLVAVRR